MLRSAGGRGFARHTESRGTSSTHTKVWHYRVMPESVGDLPNAECPGTRPFGHVDRDEFLRLRPDGREIISRWAKRADHSLTARPGNYFEPFIYAWIAFNGWAACCSKKERDREIILTLSADRELQTDFQVLCGRDENVNAAADAFRELWPILKAIQLRERGLLRGTSGLPRRDVVQEYLAADRRWRSQQATPRRPIERAPECHERHWDAHERIPLDWPHTLAAIYRVRCNLFHGEKADRSEMDKLIVASATKTLVPFVRRLIIE
jgi:hypothetical protein